VQQEGKLNLRLLIHSFVLIHVLCVFSKEELKFEILALKDIDSTQLKVIYLFSGLPKTIGGQRVN